MRAPKRGQERREPAPSRPFRIFYPSRRMPEGQALLRQTGWINMAEPLDPGVRELARSTAAQPPLSEEWPGGRVWVGWAFERRQDSCRRTYRAVE